MLLFPSRSNKLAINLPYIHCGRLYLKSVNIITPKHWKEPNVEQANLVSYKGRLNGVNLENTPVRVYQGEDNTSPPPRAIKGTPCGEAGRYIRFSSNFLSNKALISTASARLFFNEWAKFKWGVFPQEHHEPCTRFSRSLIHPSNGSACPEVQANQCVYKIQEEQSEQCKHCQGQSVQDILQQHSDFKQSNVTLLEKSDIIPTIQTFKRSPRRIVLCLDASTSMLIGGRLEMVRQAVRRFIYAVSEGHRFNHKNNITLIKHLFGAQESG